MNATSIDEWLPEYQVKACYSITVSASVERTYAALVAAKLTDLKLVRLLMKIRGYRVGGGNRGASNVPTQGCRFGSFLELTIIPEKEILLGIAGRFWRPDGGIVSGLTPQEFAAFHRDGYAKGVWNFSLAPAQNGTLLSTETRVQTFGRRATILFRLYWTLIGPFSGLMRKAMLREIQRIAEQHAN